MLVAFLLVGGILYFISSQIAGFSENLPTLITKLYQLLGQFKAWVQTCFGIFLVRQVQLINEALSNSRVLVSQTLGSALTTLLLDFILPVYNFLLLFYKKLILNFSYE